MTTTPTLREAAERLMHRSIEDRRTLAHNGGGRYDENTDPLIVFMRAALAEQAGDDYDQLACAEEVLDGLCAHLPMTETSFDCLGDYIKAAVAAIRAPAAEWLQWVAEDGYRTDRERGAARELLPLAHATPAAPAAEQAEPQWRLERMRHIANEWADMATNGLQWLRNIKEGIGTVDDALANMATCYEHCRMVNDAPGLYGESSPPAPARQEPLTDEQIAKAADAIDDEAAFSAGFYEGARFAERANGIIAATAEGEKQ